MKTVSAIIMLGALLAGCAAPIPVPTPTPTQGADTPATTAVPPTEVPSATATDTPTSRPTATPTPQPTNTPTPIPTYTLSGTVFFDYNGNGLRDEGEPPIEGVPISVGGLNTTSGPEGSYSLAGVPAGRRRIMVDAHDSFTYIVPSVVDARPLTRGLDIVVDGDETVVVPLARGPLTWPICGAASTITFYFDLDNRPGYVENWKGETASGGRDHNQIHLVDQHNGIDVYAEPTTPIVAISPGLVEWVRETSEGYDIHFAGDGYYFFEAHVLDPRVQEGTRVERYQVIGYMGDVFSNRDGWWAGDHVHMGYAVCPGPECYRDPWLHLTVSRVPYCPDGPAAQTEY